MSDVFRWACVRSLTGLVVLSLMNVSLTGCEPLRKKFIREKRASEVQIVEPVLEPVDYEARERSPDEIYNHHYQLWRVWHKDFFAAVTDGYSDKKKQSIINQLIVNLEEIRPLLKEEKQKVMNEVLSELKQMEGEFERPAAMRNEPQIVLKVKRLGKTVRRELSPEAVANAFVETR